MAEYKKEKKNFSYIPFLRNVGIIAHIDSGKTTTTERILFLCEQIHKIGEVHEGSTQTDFLELERERGITICSACVTVNWKLSRSFFNRIIPEEFCLNIIDTPGHLDFKSEVERSLRVLDGVILVMDGKEGVEPQTETVWRQANKYSIPRIIFVNKMDGVENVERFDKCLESIRKILKANPIALQFPIGAGKDLRGVVDIIEQKAFFFKFSDKEEKYIIGEVPSELKEKLKKFRTALIDTIIVYDEDLMLKYLNNFVPTIEEIRFLVRKATLSGKFFPVFCGSAYQNVGINLLLDAVIDYLPSPANIKAIPVYSTEKKEENEEIKPIKNVDFSSDLSYLALAFKVVIDDFGNTLTFIRVYAGQINNGSNIYNSTKGKMERVSVLVRMNANKETKVDSVKAGEIAVIKGLKFTRTGDTFSHNENEKENLLLEPISFDNPVISKALVPKTSKDGEKLIEALKKICIEDPSVVFEKDEKAGQIIVRGMGELHLEIIEENIKRKYKLDVNSEAPKISYQETIKSSVKTVTRYKKQSGGHGHFAEVTLFFEPNPGKGFLFLNKIRGESVSKSFADSVRKGLEEALGNGLLLGFPVIDVKVSLLDGLSHVVDSSEKDFKQVAIIACRENKEKLGLTLLEPVMDTIVSVPKEYMGDALASLGSLRMIIEDTEEEGGISKITGKSPLEKMIGYTTELRRITKGRGSLIISFSHYQEVPIDILKKMLKKKSVISENETTID